MYACVYAFIYVTVYLCVDVCMYAFVYVVYVCTYVMHVCNVLNDKQLVVRRTKTFVVMVAVANKVVA